MNTAVAAPTTFAQLWAEMETQALNLWQSVKNEAVMIEHNIVPIVEQDVVAVLNQFRGVALNTVLALGQSAFSSLTGDQKNAITVQTITQAALSQGKTIAQQDAAMLAQQAFNGLASIVASANK